MPANGIEQLTDLQDILMQVANPLQVALLVCFVQINIESWE
jgi:hypothetical protein